MAGDIYEKVTNFNEFVLKDDNHRYKSWEHCYNYFSKRKPSKDIEKACLHLSFYLASWGMYRGSSALLWKDYLVHKEVVELISTKKYLQNLDFRSENDASLNEILQLGEMIKSLYYEKIKYVKGVEKEFWASETLITKILLGTLGCIPAYDRYFIGGMRKRGIQYSGLKLKNFQAVVNFYQDNFAEFDKANRFINKNMGFKYPAMKLVDMYFWEVSYEEERK